MKLNRLVLALSTCCLAMTACDNTKRLAVAVTPPAERLECFGLSDRSRIPAEREVDWAKVLVPGDAVATLTNAQQEHARYVASIRSREGIVAGHILAIENRLFTCSNNASWLREFYAKIAANSGS